ncbi:hypothetical protein FZC66_07235 [Priestia megaterium]|nr:hypothetical protein FZC66_07235 [Priestia megaterium]
MKIVAITLLMLGCLMGFSLSIDVFQGLTFYEALRLSFSPFQVMEFAELFVLFFLIFLFVADSIYISVKQRNNNQ